MHTLILKRAGAVLLAVGLLDIGIMIYCIVNRINYSSSFNLFAVIAGIFLLRGSLRAGSIVRWMAMFMLCSFGAMLLAWPFLQPLDLTLTQLRLRPGSFVATVLVLALLLALLFWLVKTLGHPDIMAARAAAGRKQRSMRLPAVLGVSTIALVCAILITVMDSDSAAEARRLASQQAGAGDKLHVASLNMRSGPDGTFVSAMVVAWNDKQISNIPVAWKDAP